MFSSTQLLMAARPSKAESDSGFTRFSDTGRHEHTTSTTPVKLVYYIRTEWSRIYFLIYAYLNILAQSQILVISLYDSIYVYYRNFPNLSQNYEAFFR